MSLRALDATKLGLMVGEYKRASEGQWLRRLSCLLVTIPAVLWGGIAEGHNTDHDYVFMDNGVIKLGREAQAGGCVVWLSEKDGPNLISNRDLGRQMQSAVFDTLAWNPTQAGDGPTQSIIEIFDVREDYIYSKCIPLHYVPLTWYLQPEPRTAPEPRVCEKQRIHMWSEFLPESEGRAFWVRALWESRSDREGQVCGQCVHPIVFANRYFEKVLTYSGAKPWTGDTLDEVLDLDKKDITGPFYLMTEQWQGLVGDDNRGIMLMSASSNANWWDMRDRYPDGCAGGDHMKALCYVGPLDFFAVGLNPGEDQQVREGGVIAYLGDVTKARAFFTRYKPALSCGLTEDFNDGNHHGWVPNTRPTYVDTGVLSLGPAPDPPYPQDISLLRRYYGDAIYSARVKMENGEGWAGLVVHKPGEGHYWGVQPSGYIVALQHDGNVFVMTNGQTLAAAPVAEFEPRAWHTVSIETRGLDLDISVDDRKTLTVHDPMERYAAGYVSLAAAAETHALFDDVSIVTSQGDADAPATVGGLKACIAEDGAGIDLSWSNPPDSDWRFTRIVRKEGGSPEDPYDGYPCYEGKLSAYRDVDVVPGETYSYAAYAWDHAGNYAEAARADGLLAGESK